MQKAAISAGANRTWRNMSMSTPFTEDILQESWFKHNLVYTRTYIYVHIRTYTYPEDSILYIYNIYIYIIYIYIIYIYKAGMPLHNSGKTYKVK